MIAELVAYAKDKGQSLFDMLIEIYSKFGFYKEDLISITKKGKTGAEEIQEMMAGYRQNPPKSIAGSEVVEMLDYKASEKLDLRTGMRSPILMEKSNVLQFITADGSKISARPSGTEPKIKFYFSVNAPLSGPEAYKETDIILSEKIKAITKDLNLN
jgi:phosphoglucomutase